MDGTLTPVGYRTRIAERAVGEALSYMPTVVIEGPRGCGKTWLARHFARSEVLFDQDIDARTSVSVAPGRILRGEEPRLLDEWQLAPEVWNQVRHASDEGRGNGRFILTGSASPPDDATRHSGAGRISRVRLRPMSLLETGESTGEVSLRSLFAGESVAVARPDASLEDIVDAVCRGGWPRLRGESVRTSQMFLNDYLDEICRTDIAAVDGVARDPIRVRRLLESLGRNVATTAAFATLARDIDGETGVDRETVSAYVRALERLFVVEDVRHWSVHLRSKARLRKSAKRHFVDPSLAAAAVGATPDRLLKELATLGFLFESLVVRDLRIYGQGSDAAVYHYRDSHDLEADAIIETRDRRWIAVEVKLGGQEWIEEAAGSLLRLKNKVDTERVGEPSKLLIITAAGYGYDRPDGTTVVPITALAP
ncbi:ATP-binding protein [Candidatus Poriferisodalis sp.]|uniref:ATP-binding protein n=1 Tax=Candidatus Poriferisodalis sp. TaxID=3101277 RepID=UPI003B02BCC4